MQKKTAIIDGIVIPALSRQSLVEMRDGGITAAVYMSSIWDDAGQAFCNIANTQAVIRENADVAALVRSVSDIDDASANGKVGIVIGWQNSDGFGQRPQNVELFADAGLRTVSLTFNSANAAGSGCYEPNDGGLTSLGHDLVASCNRAGILLDLTHIGDRTADDIVNASQKPVCFTHAHARALKDHVRNKSDDLMRAVARKGGVIGLGALRHFHKRGLESDVTDYVQAVQYVMRVAGEDHVALGSDMTPHQPASFHHYTGRHKGNGKIMQNYSSLPAMPGLSTFDDHRHLETRLREGGVSPSACEKFLHLNWRRIFAESWSPLR